MKKRSLRIAQFLPGFIVGIGVGIFVPQLISTGAKSEATNAPAPTESIAQKSRESAISILETSGSSSLQQTSPAVAPSTNNASDQPGAAPEKKSSSSREENPAADTIAALTESIKKSSTKGKLEYLELLQELTPEDVPKMLAVFRELSQKGYKVNHYDRLLWERWAELDGPGVADVIFQRDKRFKQTNLSNLVISTWAKSEPEQAAAWLLAQEDIPLRTGMVRGLIEGIAIADPERAERFLREGQLSSDQIRNGFGNIAHQRLLQDGIDSVGEWYAAFSEDDPHFGAASRAVTQVYARTNFRDALHWGNQLKGSPESVREVRQLLHGRLAASRPDGLIAFLGSEKHAQNIAGVNHLISMSIDRWLHNTPYAMGTWLQKNSRIPNYDMIVRPFAEKVARDDVNAALAWAETIRDEETREATLQHLRNKQ